MMGNCHQNKYYSRLIGYPFPDMSTSEFKALPNKVSGRFSNVVLYKIASFAVIGSKLKKPGG
jgi:hypothetical protein